MKIKSTKLIAMLLAVCMMFSFSSVAFAAVVEDVRGDDNKITYVSIGASNANGYGMRGYLDDPIYEYPLLKESANIYGYQQEVEGSYPDLIADWLESMGWEVAREELAMSSMRAEEVRFLLDDSYKGDAYTDWRFVDVGGYTNRNSQNWFKLAGELELGYTTNDPNEAVAALKKAYRNYIADADLITLDIGINNFGVYASNQIVSNMYENDISKIDPALDAEYKKAKAYVMGLLQQYAGDLINSFDEASLNHMADSMAYTFFGFCTSFDVIVEKIRELNPDAMIVAVSIQNLMHGLEVAVPGEDETMPFGEMFGALINAANYYIAHTSEYADEYIVADVRKDGHVEFFMDELAAYNGDPATLGQDMKDCFDVYDNDLYIKSRVQQILAKQLYGAGLLNIDKASGADIANNLEHFAIAYQNDLLIIPDLDNITLAQFFAAGAAGQLLPDIAKPYYDRYVVALNTAYDVMAEIMQEGILIDTLDMNSFGKKFGPVEDALLGAFFGTLEYAVMESIADPTFSFSLSEVYPDGIFKTIAAREGWELGFVETVAAMGIRTGIGNSFYGHPNRNGHVEIANAIKTAIANDTTGDEIVEEELPIALTIEKLYSALDEKGYLSEAKIKTIIEFIAELYAEDGDISDADTRLIARCLYYTITGTSVSAFAMSRDPDAPLTDAEKIDLIKTVLGVLTEDGIIDDTQITPVLDVYDELVENELVTEKEAVNVFEYIFDAVTGDVNFDLSDKTVQQDVAQKVIDEFLGDKDPSVQLEILDTVVSTLSGSGSEGSTGSVIPEIPNLPVIKEIYADLKAAGYMTDAQAMEIVNKIYPHLLSGEELTEEAQAVLLDEIYNIVADELTYAEQADAARIIIENLDEAGIIDVKQTIKGAYEDAWKQAQAAGIIDAANLGLNAAVEALETANKYLNEYEIVVDPEYAPILENIKKAALGEIDAILDTIEKLQTLLNSETLTQENWELMLTLKDDLRTHCENAVYFAKQLNEDLTPYVMLGVDKVLEQVDVITDIAVDAYNRLLAIPAEYEAWVDDVTACVDAIDPRLGDAVRKYMKEVPADSMAIFYAYGEEAVDKLVAEALVAYGDIYTASLNFLHAMIENGINMHEMIKNNPEVQGLLDQLTENILNAEAAVNWIADNPFVTALIAKNMTQDEIIAYAYAELMRTYHAIYPVVMSVIEDIDEDACESICIAYETLVEILTTAYDSGNGYLGWLAGHTDAMGAALLAAFLGNSEEFVWTAGSIIDEMIWNLLGKIDEAIKDHVSEKFEELKEKLIAYGIDLSKDLEPQIMALLETIAEDYDRCLYNATHAEYCICGGTHNYVALGGKLTAGDSYADLFAAALEAESADSVVNPIDAVYSDDTVLLTAENLVSYVESKAAEIAAADIITYNMDAADTVTVLMNAMEGGYVDWSKYANAETLAIAEKVMAEVYARLAEKYDAAMLEAIDPIAEILVYAAVTYGVENIKALETITTINSDALVVVIGMVNPFAGVTIDYVGQKIDLGELFDYAIEATDLYNELYAMLTGKVTFVSAAGAETVTAAEPLNIVVSKDPSEFGIGDIEELTKLMEQIEYLLSGAGAYLTADGQADVYEAIAAAVAVHGHTYVFVETVAPTTESIGYDLYVCTCCGAEDRRNQKDKLPSGVIVPDVPFIPAAPAEPEHFNCDGGEGCHCNDFEDLDYTMWYHQGVCYMIEHGYMIGIGDNKWGPEQIITRAEIATILWRIAGSEVVDYALDFSDVEADMWYTEAIEWAVSEEIFLGYGDGKFGPNDQITREQMVTVMYRFELDNGKKLTADFDMTTVSDADEISDWALEAMTWALDCGLIIGTDVDVLTASPLKTATRAEVAMIFYRKLDNLLK